MKKKIAIPIVIFSLLFISGFVLSQTREHFGEKLLQAEDDFIDFVIQKVENDQIEYIKTHDNYWGGRKKDKGKWNKANFSLPANMPFSVNILHHHKSSTGETGYVIIFEKRVGKRKYKRSVGYGVAEKPLSDWVEIIEPAYHNL